MARIIGGIAVSHIAAGVAGDGRVAQEPEWRSFFEGVSSVRHWLARANPDAAIVFYSDRGLNFAPDKVVPTFAVAEAREYRVAEESQEGAPAPPCPGDRGLSQHLIEALVGESFDITMCREMLVDHGYVRQMELFWPGGMGAVRTVPICINTVRHPFPSAVRCHNFGQAIGRAVEAWDTDARVMVIGYGGLSHLLDGQRVDSINQEFDRLFMQTLASDPLWATRYSAVDLIELAGARGVELLIWLAVRGALLGDVGTMQASYHLANSNRANAAALMLMENN